MKDATKNKERNYSVGFDGKELTAENTPELLTKMFFAADVRGFRGWLLAVERAFVNRVQEEKINRFCRLWNWEFVRDDKDFWFQRPGEEDHGKNARIRIPEDVALRAGLNVNEAAELSLIMHILDTVLVSGTEYPIGMLCESYQPTPKN